MNIWLRNGHVPHALLSNNLKNSLSIRNRDGLALLDIEINRKTGIITNITPATVGRNCRSIWGGFDGREVEYDCMKGQVWSCFADIHTHIDKGHIWERSPNYERTHGGALRSTSEDRSTYWKAEDVRRRMEFALKCSYVHGTKALRTHLDSIGDQVDISFNVFKQMKEKWKDKITLQAVSLVPMDCFLTEEEGTSLANKVADFGEILGAVATMSPGLDQALDNFFKLAIERNLDVDIHTDETTNPLSVCLLKIAQAAIRNKFKKKIVCGHCVSLAFQSEDVVNQTLELVKEAGISIVSLPMCNLFLQDRNNHHTPRYRGVTLLHELKAKNIDVAISSDNCRDPFFGYGDHDMLEVFNEAVRIAHLDADFYHWPATVTHVPSKLMQLDEDYGTIKVGNRADLVIFKGRTYSELLSRRSGGQRIVLRNGQEVTDELPDYAELDDLVFLS